MNSKIYKDGNRIIVSFEGIDDAEELLQRIVRSLSSDGNVVSSGIVPDLDPPIEVEEKYENLFENDNSNVIKESEIEDFEGIYAGKTPKEIISEPEFKGYYFLCFAIRNGKIPVRYQEEAKNLLMNFVHQKNVLKPPYGNIDRMKKYCQMAQNILGNEAIPDHAYDCDDKEWLESACRAASEVLCEFRDKYLI